MTQNVKAVLVFALGCVTNACAGGTTAGSDDSVNRRAALARGQTAALEEAMTRVYATQFANRLSHEFELGDIKPIGLSQKLLHDPDRQGDDACDGPWIYRAYDCFRAETSPLCGISMPTQTQEVIDYAPCARPEFGVARVYEQAVYDWPETLFHQQLAVKSKQDAEAWVNREENRRQALTACQQRVDTIFQNREDYRDWQVLCIDVWPEKIETTTHREFNKSDFTGISNLFGGKKRIDADVDWHGKLRFMAPEYYTRENDPSCPQIRRRQVATSEAHAEQCRLAIFGREPSNVCGSTESVVLSAPGLQRAQLPESDFDWRAEGLNDAVCSTADTMLGNTPSTRGEKFTALLTHYRTLRTHTEDFDPAWLADVQQRAQWLYESEDQATCSRADVVDLYVEFPYSAPSSPNETARGEASLCDRLAQPHVSGARIAQHFEACLGLESAIYDWTPAARGVKLFGLFVRTMHSEDDLAAHLIMAEKMSERLSEFEHGLGLDSEECRLRARLRSAYLVERIKAIEDATPRGDVLNDIRITEHMK